MAVLTEKIVAIVFQADVQGTFAILRMYWGGHCTAAASEFVINGSNFIRMVGKILMDKHMPLWDEQLKLVLFVLSLPLQMTRPAI